MRRHFRTEASLAPVSIFPAFQGASTTGRGFEVRAPDGSRLLDAAIGSADLAAARQQWRRATDSVALLAFAGAVLLLAGPLLDWRNRAHLAAPYVTASLLIAAAIVIGRLLLRLASPADWSESSLFSAFTYASAQIRPLLTSPFDFLVTAVAAGTMVALLFAVVEAWRVAWRHRRVAATGAARVGYAIAHLAAGVVVAALIVGYERFLHDTVGNTTLDLLHLSVHPWNPARLALQMGLIVWHASALALAVLVLRAASVLWRVPRRTLSMQALTIVLWAAPLAIWELGRAGVGPQRLPSLVAAAAVIATTLLATRIKARFRHGSQAFRLSILTLGLVVPALVFYPAVYQMAWRAKAQLVETRFAPQAINQRQTIQSLLSESLAQIDQFPGISDLLTVAGDAAAEQVPIDRAFQVWRVTSMADYPLTSSVELYAMDGALLSRFAFNLPEDLSAAARWQEPTCSWGVFEEVTPFFAEERRVLHAGRAVCLPDGRKAGSIVVHAMLDYENLPFISSQNPYVELLRPEDPLRSEDVSGRDVEFAFYGWSRTPLYPYSGTAWPLDDAVFEQVLASREPRWAELERGDERFDVYLMNDRGGIYALGFPIISPLGHMVSLAELTVLAALTYFLLLGLSMVFGAFGRRGTTARALLREVRASFYRKLFLAFVLAATVPVIALALVARAYVSNQMLSNIESEAVRTASAARRVVEDFAAPRAAEQGVVVDDNLMVWVSRLIDQDVNIFSGPRLLATSERNLFASGLLPTRTPGDVYQGLALRNEAATVTRERIAALDYMVAASPVDARDLAGDADRAAHVPAAGDRTGDRYARSPGAAGGAALHPGWCRHRLLDGGTDRGSGEPSYARHTAARARRPRRARCRDLVRRAAPPRRGLQQHGGRPPAPARGAGAHAPARGLGGDGAAGRARDQEPAHADSAQRGTPPPRPCRPRRAARRRAPGVRRHDPAAGHAAATDRVRVLQLRLLADGAADGGGCDRRSFGTSSIPTAPA